jgi:hypothetical protein
MIFDIDRSETVIEAVDTITARWFNVRELYRKLKDNDETDSPRFWAIPNHLLEATANQLAQPLDVFVHNWCNCCFANDLEIIGYHCTRAHNQQLFQEQGIIPVNERNIEIFFSIVDLAFQPFIFSNEHKRELFEIIKNNSSWKYRSGKTPGPYFFLSYKDAKSTNNYFHKYGTELWWPFVDIMLRYCQNKKDIAFPCSDRNKCREIIAGKLSPLIIHCAIPFSILPSHNYYIFCMLKAYFLFVDPEDDSDNLFEGYSIDLCGKTLDPKYIFKIEEINEAETSI